MKQVIIFDVLINGESVAKFAKQEEAMELKQKLERALDKEKSVVSIASYDYEDGNKRGLE